MAEVRKLEQGDLRVELEWIGEGLDGDYDPDDSQDVPLLRFSLWQRKGGDWDYVEDTSYCCQVGRDAQAEEIEAALRTMMREFRETIEAGGSIRRTAEHLSWIGSRHYPAARST